MKKVPQLSKLPKNRVFALDSARNVLMLLGLVVHSGSLVGSFRVASGDFADQGVIFSAVLVHSFRMPAFFAISGIFAAILFSSRGASGFWKQRVRRLVWPLIACELTIVPLTLAIGFEPLETWDDFVAAGWMHLWFIYYLLIFSGAITILRLLRAKRASQFAEAKHLFNFSAAWIVNPVSILLFSAASCTIPGYFNFEAGALEKSSSFIPDIWLLLFYFVFFSFGYLIAHRWHSISTALSKLWWLNLVLGLSTFASYYFLFEQDSENLFIKFLYTSTSWLLTFSILGVVTKFTSRPTNLSIYLADASYWIYIVHFPIVIATLNFFASIGTPYFWTFVLSIVSTLALAIISYELVVRNTIIGKFLAGRIDYRMRSSRNKKVRR